MYEYETLYCDGGHWFERRVVRGRKPSLCPSCKRAVQIVRNPNPRPRTPSSNLVIADGGKKEAGFAGEKNDCTVRAVALACDVPYRDAYLFMQKNGRRKNKGSYFHSVVMVNNYDILGKQVKPEGILAAKGIKTALLRNPKLRKGTWMVHMTHHVAVLKDGVLMDSFDSSRKQINGAWRVL